MKKIVALLMLFCTISVFAANAADTYIGKLSVSVKGGTPTVNEAQNVSVVEGSVVTFTIPKFSFPGSPIAADVVITATKDAQGVLVLKTIKYGFIPIASAEFTNSTLKDNQCNINLKMNSGGNVEVIFNGTKQ